MLLDAKYISEEFFDEHYPLEKNHLLGLNDEDLANQSFNGCMFETYGAQLQYVISKVEENKVISIIEINNKMRLASGYFIGESIGYLISVNPIEKPFKVKI